ncbi:MAG: peptidylprolyl isomerase [Candidatus Kerfeldbacteria bacterium]|nr:peptidylprolyl isomerase [Candidatus Kerfeldbacteria bacterium]
MKKVSVILVILLLGAGGYLVIRSRSTNETPATSSRTNTQTMAKLADTPTVTVVTSKGTFTIKLYSEAAPELTKNFVELAKTGYYNGLTFHRIIPGFVVQGGDPKGDGTGGHSYKGDGTGLADEPGALAIKHVKGAVAWAKSSLPNSIGSQFYIALDNLTDLDGSYSVFGQVVEGLAVVDAIAAVETDPTSRPLEPVTMTTVTVNE